MMLEIDTKMTSVFGLRKNGILLYFMIMWISVSAQKSVDIKGYYLQTFNASQIKSLYNQRLGNVQGGNHTINIDYESSSYFIPINDKENDSVRISKELLRRTVNSDSIYIIPTYKDISFLGKMGIASDSLLNKNCCIIDNALKLSPYYIIEDLDDYFFRSVYIEGQAKSFNIHSFEEKWQPYMLDVYSTSSVVEKQQIIILTDIIKYTPYKDDSHLQKWLPSAECR